MLVALKVGRKAVKRDDAMALQSVGPLVRESVEKMAFEKVARWAG